MKFRQGGETRQNHCAALPALSPATFTAGPHPQSAATTVLPIAKGRISNRQRRQNNFTGFRTSQAETRWRRKYHSMSEQNKTRKIPNDLWIARKRLGLEQKHIACLLHHKTTAQVSRYEKGTQVPSLRGLIQLEIVYRTPLKFLYPELYEQVRLEIRSRIANNSLFVEKYKGLAAQPGAGKMDCPYLEILEKPSPSQEEKTCFHNHVLYVLRQRNEMKW